MEDLGRACPQNGLAPFREGDGNLKEDGGGVLVVKKDTWTVRRIENLETRAEFRLTK